MDRKVIALNAVAKMLMPAEHHGIFPPPLKNLSVTYAETGKYTVTLRAYNDEYEHVCTKEEFIYVVPDEDLVFLLPFDGDIKDYGPYGLDPSVYSLGGLNVSYDSGHGDGYGESLQFPGGTNNQIWARFQSNHSFRVTAEFNRMQQSSD